MFLRLSAWVRICSFTRPVVSRKRSGSACTNLSPSMSHTWISVTSSHMWSKKALRMARLVAGSKAIDTGSTKPIT
ncbi:hypothetical protein D3C87_1541590 [compost metagenome]